MESRSLQKLIPRDEHAAAIALGRQHPLVKALALGRTLAKQLLVTFIAALLALVGTLRDVALAPLFLGSSFLVAIVIAGGLVAVRARTRWAVQEVIATGCDDLSLGVVVRERTRLGSCRERERLACSLELFIRDAEHWAALHPPARPFLDVRCLRSSGREARMVVVRLRNDPAGVRGVARAACLLTDGSSPLFGSDAHQLREELVQIADDLVCAPAGEMPRDRPAA